MLAKSTFSSTSVTPSLSSMSLPSSAASTHCRIERSSTGRAWRTSGEPEMYARVSAT
jgi:hypothetical protein